ncbi:hypothetical protein LCGC14_0599740 [marine sediment metagenome]|uniref:Uncharacterized protein n=1 Tax=marine sediment metagenome TaxID=412755 RepID=A0A0F9RFR9_9ZZZZ
MWQLLGKGKTTLALHEAHNVTSTPKGRKCSKCGKTKALDCFSYEDRDECKWCMNEYRVALNASTQSQADRTGWDWTDEEDQVVRAKTEDGWTDESIAYHLKRSLSSVRTHRCRVLGINKRAKAAPKPVLNEFVHVKEDVIKKVTIHIDKAKITVYSNTHTPPSKIGQAFVDKGLTAGDYQAWRVGGSAGA